MVKPEEKNSLTEIRPNQPSIAVVIPIYNEAAFIAGVIQSIPEWVQYCVVINDGSTDRSRDIVSSLKDRRLILLDHTENRGVGAAIVTGYRYCMNIGVDIVVVVGGDGQMDPLDMKSLVEPLINNSADYVKGSRFLDGKNRQQVPLYRRAGILLFTFMTRLVTANPGLTDAQCGYTAVSTRCLGCIEFDQLCPRYGFPNDMIIHITRTGQRLAEVPVQAIYGDEISGIRPLIDPLIIGVRLLKNVFQFRILKWVSP